MSGAKTRAVMVFYRQREDVGVCGHGVVKGRRERSSKKHFRALVARIREKFGKLYASVHDGKTNFLHIRLRKRTKSIYYRHAWQRACEKETALEFVEQYL
jgi:hypothetical protein